MSYSGQRVIVSGGSMGTGRALALQLAREGADVCILARGTDALEQTLAELRKASGRHGAVLMARSVDVTDSIAVDAQAAEVVAELGGLDLVICNQGFAKTGLVADVPAHEFSRMIDVNFLGHAHLCKAFSPHLVDQGSGTIVLVASVLGYLGTYGYAPYAASKWAIVGFAECLRQEMVVHGVDVKVVYPGTIDTPGLAQENLDKPPVVWAMESGSPFNKTRSPEVVAGLILKAATGSRFENPLGWDGRLTFWASRHLPRVVRRLNDHDLRKAIRKNP